MATRFDTDGDGLDRTTSLLDYNNPYSFMGWFYLVTDRNNFTTFMVVHQSTGSYDHLGTDGSGTLLRLDDIGSAANGTDLALTTWYHLAMVRESATSLKAYLNGVVDLTLTNNAGSRGGVVHNEISTFTGLTRHASARVQAIKMYDAALTQAEVQQEMRSILPRRLANINAWYPCFPGSTERLKDYSGNGRNWTEVGTLSDEDPGPLGWGSPVSIYPVVSVNPTLEQEGFRWRNDDGSQAAATWRQAQDVNDSVDLLTNIRLRMLLNSTGNNPSQSYGLQVRKQGAGDNAWRDIQS